MTNETVNEQIKVIIRRQLESAIEQATTELGIDETMEIVNNLLNKLMDDNNAVEIAENDDDI